MNLLTKKNIIFVFCIILIFSDHIFAESIDDMSFYTEEYPPYNFTKNGTPRGFAVDILAEMLTLLKSSTTENDFKFRPWSNSYRKLELVKNICLFSTTRTDERENKFKWVGPISKNIVGLTARKDHKIKIHSLEDVKKYRIGGIRDDFSIQLLLDRGISKSKIQQVAKTRNNIDKLNMGRIDVWAYGINVAMWELKSNGFNLDDYEVVYILDDRYELYYAVNMGTSDKLVQDLQWALDELKASGVYQKIMNKYVK